MHLDDNLRKSNASSPLFVEPVGISSPLIKEPYCYEGRNQALTTSCMHARHVYIDDLSFALSCMAPLPACPQVSFREVELALWADTAFLASLDIMDYSLLVGVLGGQLCVAYTQTPTSLSERGGRLNQVACSSK